MKARYKSFLTVYVYATYVLIVQKLHPTEKQNTKGE